MILPYVKWIRLISYRILLPKFSNLVDLINQEVAVDIE